jgi:hypothetical protein
MNELVFTLNKYRKYLREYEIECPPITKEQDEENAIVWRLNMHRHSYEYILTLIPHKRKTFTNFLSEKFGFIVTDDTKITVRI